jgi:hypothetical protein
MTSEPTLTDCIADLARPFPIDYVQVRPGAVAIDGTAAIALPYVDWRLYAERLDQVVGVAHWSIQLIPWGPTRVIARLTILGVTKDASGEGDPNDTNCGTIAEAQAKKRACAEFGLGRYFYTLPKVWGKGSGSKRDFRFAEGEAQRCIYEMYRRAALLPAPEPRADRPPTTATSADRRTSSPMPTPTVDNMLKLTSQARLAALDTRLLVGGEDAPQCKINALVDRVAWLYQSYDAAKATQLIFCDLATPKGKREAVPEVAEVDADTPPAEETTAAEQSIQNDVYQEIRRKLTSHGIPVGEVAFIHDYPTKARRDELFAAMNAGSVRVLIGSTSRMGTGMNVQRRLIALHHLDAPWRPGDVEQRDGRILRQGNLWPQVYVFHYITERSFDAYTWQLLENKARFISQVMSGEVTARSADDIGDTVLTAAEVKAIASGNPRILERFRLETELAKLDRVRRTWSDTRTSLEWKRRCAHGRIADRERRITELESVLPIEQAHAGADFAIALEARVGDTSHVTYTKRADAGKALVTLTHQYQAAARFQRQTIVRTIGMYRGFALCVHAPHHELASAKLLLVADSNEQPVEVVGRVFAHDISALGVFASIDAGLRDIAEEIRRKQARNRDDETEIAACDAELERTATWEHEERWQRLCAELAAVTTALAMAETPAAAEPLPAGIPNPSASLSAASATVSAEAIAAAEQAVANHADDPAWQIVTTPLEHSIAPAIASLELLRTFAVAPTAAEDTDASSLEAESDRMLEQHHTQPDEETDDTLAVLELPLSIRPARPRLVFGDVTVLAQLRRSRTTREPFPTAPPSAPDQLDLFATLEIPLRRAQEREPAPVSIGAQQLPLL